MKFVVILVLALFTVAQAVSLQATEKSLMQLEAELDSEEKMLEEWNFNWNKAKQRLLAAKKWAMKMKKRAEKRVKAIQKAAQSGDIAGAVAEAKKAVEGGIKEGTHAANWAKESAGDFGVNQENEKELKKMIAKA